jgi:hypothetical protein
VPPEAIVGAYVIGADRRPTGDYLRNPRYGPVRDDLTRLESPDRQLGWIPGDPARAVRGTTRGAAGRPGRRITRGVVKAIDEPHSPRPLPGSPSGADGLIVRRAAVAVPSALGVRLPGRRPEILTGVLTWAAAGLDIPAVGAIACGSISASHVSGPERCCRSEYSRSAKFCDAWRARRIAPELVIPRAHQHTNPRSGTRVIGVLGADRTCRRPKPR